MTPKQQAALDGMKATVTTRGCSKLLSSQTPYFACNNQVDEILLGDSEFTIEELEAIIAWKKENIA